MVKYCTTRQLLGYLNMVKSIPEFVSGTEPSNELVGTGTTTATTFYTDNNKVISDTYTFYYGSDASTTATLTETTDYTFDYDNAKLTLTATGLTTVGTDNIYTKYDFIQSDSMLNDTELQNVIDRVTAYINEETESYWEGLVVKVREEHTGQGTYRTIYKPLKFPVNYATTTLNGAISTTTATTLVVDDSTGFTAGDYLSVDTEAMLISTVDSTTAMTVSRGELDSTATTHADGTDVINTVIEISNTSQGFEPTWSILEYKNEFDIDSDTGGVQLLNNNLTQERYTRDVFPPQFIFDRYRMTYTYGASTVPKDVEKLAILITAKDLYNSQVLNAITRGTDGFQTDAINIIDAEINRILKDKKRMLLSIR